MEIQVKHKHKILLSIFTVSMLCVLILNAQMYKYPKKENLEKKFNYLSRIIQDSTTNSVSKLNAEWDLFTLSFSTYAATNLVDLDSSFKQQAIKTIDAAIKKVLSNDISRHWMNNGNFPQEIDSGASVLYLGQLNLMLGCYRSLSEDSHYNALNDKISAHLAKYFSAIPYMCLQSYEGQIWIPDNTVALASLEMHSRNTGSDYDEVCKKWVEYTKKHFIDKKTGLLYSTVNYRNGEPMEEPRGAMIGWSIFFIYRFDEAFAEELYKNYKANFSNNLLVFRLYRERYENWSTNKGDFDSGPLILGYSIPANAFAFAGAVAFHDKTNAKRLRRVISLGSKEVENKDEIFYQTRFIDFEISPLAEALILFSETMTEWKAETK